MKQTAHDIIAIWGRLDEHDQALVLGMARRLAANDVASEDDIATHQKAVAEYERGECARMTREDWDR
jgi:hypothetical protein